MTAVYENVIFDMDGTLLDSAPGVINALHYSLDRLGISVSKGFNERAVVGPPLAYTFNFTLGLDMEATNKAVALYREYYGPIGAFEAELFHGIADLLRDLKSAGAAISLATSKYSVMAEKMMDHFNIRPYFDFAAMSQGREVTSQKKKMIEQILADSGTPPDRTVMIGDTSYDAEGARQAGTAFIGVLYGYGGREEMEAEGGRVFAADVAGLRSLLLPE